MRSDGAMARGWARLMGKTDGRKAGDGRERRGGEERAGKKGRFLGELRGGERTLTAAVTQPECTIPVAAEAEACHMPCGKLVIVPFFTEKA